jgi:hypothetical protein
MKPFIRTCLLIAAVSLSTQMLAKADEVVKWPNLKKLDDVAERCEALCDSKNIPELRKIAAAAKAAAVTVENDKIPANAKDKERVKTLQSDLKSLTDVLGDPKTEDGDELMGVLSSIHPIVEQLMEASGMPHVHEEPKKNQAPAAR